MSSSVIIAFIKKYWFYFVIVISMLIIGKSCEDNGKLQAKNDIDAITISHMIQLDDSLSKMLLAATTPIIVVQKQIDTLWRIRTLILPKVDSAWRLGDSIIALVPQSDTNGQRCHLAYIDLKTGCELLKEIVKKDSIVIKSADSVLTESKVKFGLTSNALHNSMVELADVKKSYVCEYKVLFIHPPCLSRTASALAGAGVIEVLNLLFNRKQP